MCLNAMKGIKTKEFLKKTKFNLKQDEVTIYFLNYYNSATVVNTLEIYIATKVNFK